MSGFLGNSGILFKTLAPNGLGYCSYSINSNQGNTTQLNYDIYYDDIIPPLCHINRYNGHTFNGNTISVGEHLLGMCWVMEFYCISRDTIRHGLIHDFHEAYTGDITTDMKGVIDSKKISEVSDAYDNMIYKVIGIEPPTYAQKSVVTSFDLHMLYLERKLSDGDRFREDIWGQFNMFGCDEDFVLDKVSAILELKPHEVVNQLSAKLLEYGIIETNGYIDTHKNKNGTVAIKDTAYRFKNQNILVDVFTEDRYRGTVAVPRSANQWVAEAWGIFNPKK